MILHKFFNLSFTEVARAMEISPRIVGKHIAKGVAECLRHMMIVERRADGSCGVQAGNVVARGVFEVRDAISILSAIAYSMPVRVVEKDDVIVLMRKSE